MADATFDTSLARETTTSPARSVVGRVESLDLDDGIVGWAYDVDDPAAPLTVELWAGPVLLATTAADLFRADLGSETRPDFNPGFVFSAATLRTAGLNLALDPQARLVVRGGDTELPVVGPSLGSFAQLQEAIEEAGVPFTNSSGFDLRTALEALVKDAALIRSRPLRPVASGARGVIERIVLLDRDTLAIGGWMTRDLPLEQAAVVLMGEKHAAAMSVASYERRDLPDHVHAFVGVLHTRWRPPARGAEFFLFVGEQGQWHLRTNGLVKLEGLTEIEAAINRASATDGLTRVVELRQMLLANQGWQTSSDAATALGVAASLDRIVLVPGFGALVDGWILAGPRRVAGMSLKLGAAVLDLDPATLQTNARADLEKGFPALKASTPRAGFHATFVGRVRADDLLDPMLKVRFADGATLTLALNPGLVQVGGAQFDVETIAHTRPGFALEPGFDGFARARARLIRREVIGSVRAVIPASGPKVIVLALPENPSDLSLVLQGAAKAVETLAPNVVLAVVAQPTQNRERVLRWVRQITSAVEAEGDGPRCSLVLIDHVRHAPLALAAIAKIHRAERVAFVGCHVWPVAAGWAALADALDAIAPDQPTPAFLPVADPRRTGDGRHDDELFVWTAAGLAAWSADAAAPFTDAGFNRGLPSGTMLAAATPLAFRLAIEDSAFKAELDRHYLPPALEMASRGHA